MRVCDPYWSQVFSHLWSLAVPLAITGILLVVVTGLFLAFTPQESPARSRIMRALWYWHLMFVLGMVLAIAWAFLPQVGERLGL